MAIVGLIPFVYAAIKRKRRSTSRAADRYAGPAAAGDARVHEHARGAYQSQSCHFAVVPSLEEELGFFYDDFGAALRPPSKDKDLSRSRELVQTDRYKSVSAVAPACGPENPLLDGGHQSQSCRFAVRPPSPVDEHVASRQLPLRQQPEDLSRQLLLPAVSARGWEHARSNGSAYQSQSCRFAVRRSAAYDYELGLSHDKEYSAASTSPEYLSGKLLFPAGRRERGLSRSLRFSSLRVLAWVSGA